MNETRLKAEIDPLVNKIVGTMRVDMSSEELKLYLKKNYLIGLDKAEVQFGVNFYPSLDRVNMLEKMTFDNIQGMNEDLGNKLRQELQRGLLNFENVSSLKKRVKKVMDVGIERARMIARTEMNRASNMGHIDGARQSELKLVKRWDAHLDNRTSAICNALDGTTIPLDSKFKYEGKEWDSPPSHPNCRSVLIFVEEGIEK